MGWSSGSEMMSRIIKVIDKNIDDMENRRDVFAELIDIFERYDCDNLCECLGESVCFDAAYNDKYPQEEDDEDETLYNWHGD